MPHQRMAAATHHSVIKVIATLVAGAALMQPRSVTAEAVHVRYTEGLMHGFLSLRNLDGKLLADGDMTQVAKGDRVTSHLVFHFRDGSVYEDTAIFSEHEVFRLLSDHVVQRGPAFKQMMDSSLDGSTGQITVRYSSQGGQDQVVSERLQLPADIANGMLLTLVKDISPSTPATAVSMVVTTPKPRLVELEVSPNGKAAIKSGGTIHQTVRYLVKVKIGGVAGFFARLLGKQPPDTRVWVLTGGAPAFVRWEGPFYYGGPIWRVELAPPAKFPAVGSLTGHPTWSEGLTTP